MEAALGVDVSTWRESDHDDDELEDFFFSRDVLFFDDEWWADSDDDSSCRSSTPLPRSESILDSPVDNSGTTVYVM